MLSTTLTPAAKLEMLRLNRKENGFSEDLQGLLADLCAQESINNEILSARDSDGATLLHQIGVLGATDTTLERFLKHVPARYFHVRNNEDQIPVCAAIRAGNYKVANLFLAKHDDLTEKQSLDIIRVISHLLAAIETEDVFTTIKFDAVQEIGTSNTVIKETLALAIDHGFKVNATCLVTGKTPLFYTPCVASAEVLLAAGANPNHADKTGALPWERLQKPNRLNRIIPLMTYGLQVLRPGSKGVSLFDAQRENANPKLKAHLISCAMRETHSLASAASPPAIPSGILATGANHDTCESRMINNKIGPRPPAYRGAAI